MTPETSAKRDDVYVYYTSGKTPVRLPRPEFERLAQNSILRGSVLRRGGEVFSKELEGFEARGGPQDTLSVLSSGKVT